MTDAQLLKRVHLKLMEWSRQRAIAKRRDRLDRQEKRTEFELFLDTAKAEGYDVSNPVHERIVVLAWLTKQGEKLPDEDDGMEQDHERLTF